MFITGTIKNINNELNYGFITVPKLGDVFVSEDTDFTQKLSFHDLKEGQKIQVNIIDTERGLFAKEIAPVQATTNKSAPQPTL